MKQLLCTAAALATLITQLPANAQPSLDQANRFGVAARTGFNLSARFVGGPPLPAFANLGRTPDGLPFNYDDGYVYADSSGSVDGWTWNWGYDDKAAQREGDTVVMHRSEAATGIIAPASTLDDEPSFGGEITYSRFLVSKEKIKFGIEAAANFLYVSINDDPIFNGDAIRTPFSHSFEPGTEPPPLPPSTGSYYGSSNASGFMIMTSPAIGNALVIPNGAVLNSHRKFDAQLWGFRLGPTVEWLASERLRVAVSGGLAVGLLDSDSSWSQTVSVANDVWIGSNSGGGHDFDVLWGGYVAANVSWRLSDRWDVNGGVQYQSLGNYSHSFDGQQVDMDLRNTVFLTVGLGYNF